MPRAAVIRDAGSAEVSAVADPQPEALEAVTGMVPGAELAEDFEALLDCYLDGIVIATPSALHAEQAIAALERGLAVFCQKPLARDAAGAEVIVFEAEQVEAVLEGVPAA